MTKVAEFPQDWSLTQKIAVFTAGSLLINAIVLFKDSIIGERTSDDNNLAYTAPVFHFGNVWMFRSVFGDSNLGIFFIPTIMTAISSLLAIVNPSDWKGKLEIGSTYSIIVGASLIYNWPIKVVYNFIFGRTKPVKFFLLLQYLLGVYPIVNITKKPSWVSDKLQEFYNSYSIEFLAFFLFMLTYIVLNIAIEIPSLLSISGEE